MQMLQNRKIKGMMVLEEDPEILLCACMSVCAVWAIPDDYLEALGLSDWSQPGDSLGGQQRKKM